MIGPVIFQAGPPSPHQMLTMRRDVMRHIVRIAGQRADEQIEAAIDAANHWRLLTAWRHTREAWRLWGQCYEAAKAERECERRLAALEAS